MFQKLSVTEKKKYRRHAKCLDVDCTRLTNIASGCFIWDECLAQFPILAKKFISTLGTDDSHALFKDVTLEFRCLYRLYGHPDNENTVYTSRLLKSIYIACSDLYQDFDQIFRNIANGAWQLNFD